MDTKTEIETTLVNVPTVAEEAHAASDKIKSPSAFGER